MRFQYRSEFHCTPEKLFQFHERPDALSLLTPPGAGVRVIRAAPSLRVGAEALLSVPLLGPIRKTWHARHTVYEPPTRFVDEQVSGPFRKWRHEHRIEATPAGAALIDNVEYELPLGIVGRLAADWVVRRQLRAMFRFRHDVTKQYVEA
jgi:ligand-binding SRPBCC domain-containing protein